MDNLQVAQAWLRIHDDQGKQGAVFCNDNDELCVVDREDRVELLQTSSFISRLQDCLIFLDEAHTRGIDLKLPQHFRAAVTLGANLVKDKLVQGKSKNQNMTSRDRLLTLYTSLHANAQAWTRSDCRLHCVPGD